MKYLQLYEAFQSPTISKIVRFLDKKLNKSQSRNFIESLRSVMSNFDIQIDKIKEEDVFYLNRKSALNLKKSATNKFEISYIKFWFSMDEGYIGFTGTGNKEVDFEKWKKLRSGKYSGQNLKFSERELDYIKNNLEITKGILKPVSDYTKIKTGDKLIGIFESDESEIHKLSMSTAWVDEDGSLFCIQNIAPGGQPRNATQMVNGEMVRWRDYGDTHWSMGNLNSPADDHRKLHHYTYSEDPLHYEEEREDVKKAQSENPLNWNLPIRKSSIHDWGYVGFSIEGSDDLEKCDFAVVIDLENVLLYSQSPTEIKKQRIESRKGATSLISDRDLREININNYVSKILANMEIKTDTTSVKDLEKLMMKFSYDKYTLISVINGLISTEYISKFANNIKNLLSGSDNEYYLERMASDFKGLQKNKFENLNKFNESYNYLKKGDFRDSSNYLEVLEKVYEIGLIMSKYFNEKKIETHEDLRLNYHALKNLGRFLEDNNFTLSREMNNIINSFSNYSDIKYYTERYNYSDESKKSDLEKLTYIKKYVVRVLS